MDNSNHNTKNNNGSEPTELFNTLPLIILSIFFGINQILGKIINSYILPRQVTFFIFSKLVNVLC